MKMLTLRLLFTLAILAGLAAAPDAQTFRWEPNSGPSISDRVNRAVSQAQRIVERHVLQAERLVERQIAAAERRAAHARRNADRALNREALRMERDVRARVQRHIREEMRYHRSLAKRVARPSARRYADMQTGTDADPCQRYHDRDDDQYEHCEVRESPLNVDAGQNGGVTVDAWDRNEIRVRAIVRGHARSSEARARDIANQVQVQAGGGRVYATGPDLERREWWSVSYRINVPRRNDLDLSATNGGITINGVTGTLRFDTTNGGVRLNEVGGRVNGQTRNGGLNITLSGDRWDGDGLDVETSNGGVNLAIPDGYNAELETRTVNGGLRIDFPVTVQGELTSRRGISTTLGAGGPLVRVRTTNGGVRINRR
jgi:hypothetical protein